MNADAIRRKAAEKGLITADAELSEKELYGLAKLATQSSADLLEEWFETDALKGTKAASGGGNSGRSGRRSIGAAGAKRSISR